MVLFIALLVALVTVPTVPLVVTYFLVLPSLRTRWGRALLRGISMAYLVLLWKVARSLEDGRFATPHLLSYAIFVTVALLVVAEIRFAMRGDTERVAYGRPRGVG